MKRIIFALFFAILSVNVFAGNASKEDITKDTLKENYAKESSSLKKELAEKQQVSTQQTKKQYYQNIVDEVNKAINRSIEISEQSYQKYKNMRKTEPEYLNSFLQDIKGYKELQKSQVANKIADYINKNFDITKMTALHAICFSHKHITLDFKYIEQNMRVIYLVEGDYPFSIDLSKK